MKMPRKPPNADDIIGKVIKESTARFLELMKAPQMVDDKGRYLHWDEFRFKLGQEGIPAEEAWAALRLARRTASQRLVLTDKAGDHFTFAEPPSLKAMLRNLDMNAGGNLGSDVTGLSSGEGRIHLARSLAEEPFASSLIEGAATTRQIAKKLIFEGRSPRTKDELMVLNNYRALQFVKSRRGEPLTMAALLELHVLVTDGTLDDPKDAGRIRDTDDIQVVDEADNEILHQPPAAADLKERLGRLIEFANRSNEGGMWIHPLVKAFALHFMLSYEHPFVDGNGRVARALFYWSALSDGYWLIEYVSISSVIAESKIQYGKSFLFVETDASDLTYFLIYHAKILETAITRLMEYVTRRRTELRAFEKRMSDRSKNDGFNHRQSWALNEMARGRLARLTISDHEGQHGVSYLTARADLESLAAASLLRKTKAGRTSIYLPARDLVARLTAS